MERSVILSQGDELQAPLGELKLQTTVSNTSYQPAFESVPAPLTLEEMEENTLPPFWSGPGELLVVRVALRKCLVYRF